MSEVAATDEELVFSQLALSLIRGLRPVLKRLADTEVQLAYARAEIVRLKADSLLRHQRHSGKVIGMTKKTEYLGKESGKSSSRWFGRADKVGTEGAKHGHGARAGDGYTTSPGTLLNVNRAFKFLRAPKK